jgi:hypothetical protein
MASTKKDTEVAGSGAVAGTPAGTQETAQGAISDGPPKGWQEVASDRLVYKPELCQGRSIQGILMARLELPDGPNDEPWHAYVVRCTAPTLGVDREGKVQEVRKGEEVLIPQTYRLADLQRAAENLEIAWEVWIKPKHQVNLGGGKKMWTYTVAVNPKSGRRTEDMKFFLGGNVTGAGAVPQLGAGGGGNGGRAASNAGVIGADAEDIPFG